MMVICLGEHILTISLRAIENTSCSHRLLLPAAALWFILSQEPVGGGIVCFGFFQLEDIVDFLLIHRPYGFIVQFLMINTGNGGSFVQL